MSWRSSIAMRYAVVSLLAAVLPLAIVGVLYDRYSSDLVARLTGERLERRLTVIGSRLSAFLDARFYQLETLAEYPALTLFLRPPYVKPMGSELKALVQFEADEPNLYGILLFSKDGTMVHAIAGQAAAGPPYWGAGDLQLDGLARVKASRGDVLGPIAPSEGRPASLLFVRALPSPRAGPTPSGRIALHVRLASLTELLGAEDEAGVFRPILLTPDGAAYSNVGLPGPQPQNLLEGAEILPGWRPALAVEWDRLAAPLRHVRYVLIAGIALVVALLTGLFIRLSRRLSQRVNRVVDGAQAVAAGDLSWRIEARGDDEIARLARTFNAMAERLRQVIRSTVEVEKMAVLGQFATEVAHEVRNPLAAMKTSVQALVGVERDGQRREILVGVGEEIDRLEETLNDLLNYARPRQPNASTVSVQDLFRRVTTMVQKQARDAGVEVSVSSEPDMIVRVDESQMQQILINLTLNALQAMPAGGRLALRAARNDGTAELEVSDTGAGMTDEVLAKVTQPFFTTRQGGTGLGLAISRQLVEMNGGNLAFTSRPGTGTTVTVKLPLTGGAGS